MELLLKLTPAEDIQQHVLPMLYRGLDCESPQVHELCLGVLPTFAGLLDHSNVKNSVLPRIKKLCLNTSTLSVRVNCLLCVGKLLEHLDKWLVLDEVLPFLPQIPSREPAVLMGILGIYKISLTHKKLGITKEIIASRVLPFLIPLCIENGLTIPQFNALTTLVKDMFQLVETEHRSKLEQLNSVKNEQKILATTIPVIAPSSKPIELDSAFEGLGLDNYISGDVSVQQKKGVIKQQEAAKMFSNQSFNTPPKSELDNVTVPSVTKPVSFSLMDDWTSSPLIHNAFQKSQSNNTTWENKIEDPIPGNNTFPKVQNENSFIDPNSNINATFQTPIQSVGPINVASNLQFQSYNNSFSSPNPWSSNQMTNTLNKTDNSQNWSALDNLLPVNAIQNPKMSMNMMAAHKNPLMPNNNSVTNTKNGNKYGLSNKDIADLLG